MHHLLTNNILSPTQYAFRPNSSTALALKTILNTIYASTKQRNYNLAIYVDLSKAYDTISHAILIHKLQHEFNFDPDTTAFFASYFTNRQQTTHTQHAQSKTATITHGIPQGSTLSTTLFLLYINNIIQTVPNSRVYTYADDTTMLIAAKSLEELQRLAQSDLSSLISYFYDNNLVPNPTKTNYSLFLPKPPPPEFSLTIGDTALKHNNEAKLLGIYVENTLKHTHTITHIIRKLQPHIQSFRYATTLLPRTHMINLYYSLVYPHLIYAITIWGSSDPQKAYLQPLIKIQKAIIRIVLNCPPQTHTKPLMIKYKLLSITNLYIYCTCTEMHPYVLNTESTARPEHDHIYNKANSIHDHNTRNALQESLFRPRSPNSFKQHPPHEIAHYTNNSSKIWNQIPPELKTMPKLQTFKIALKEHLHRKQTLDR